MGEASNGSYDFDLVVIGAGSGGTRAARCSWQLPVASSAVQTQWIRTFLSDVWSCYRLTVPDGHTCRARGAYA